MVTVLGGGAVSATMLCVASAACHCTGVPALTVVVTGFDSAARVHSMVVTAAPAPTVTVAIPVAIFLIVLGLLNTRMSDQPTASGPILLTAVLVLAAAAATRIVTLPLSIVVMVVLVALLLAYHLAAAHRTA